MWSWHFGVVCPVVTLHGKISGEHSPSGDFVEPQASPTAVEGDGEEGACHQSPNTHD